MRKMLTLNPCIWVSMKQSYFRNGCQKYCSFQKKNKWGKYSATVQSPKTDFPLWVSDEERILLDKKIEKDSGFDSLYEWQRENVVGQKFVFTDSPPCANGRAHIGHAINKNFSRVELMDILQVANVTYTADPKDTEFTLQMVESKNKGCERCQKYVCSLTEELCSRCSHVA